MKKLLLVGLCLLTSLTYASNEEFAKEFSYSTSYKAALLKSKETHKPMMILFVTTSCPWCKKLENQTLSKPRIDGYIQKNFTPVILDKELDTFPKSLDPQVVPTIYFVNQKDEKQFSQIIGYKAQKEFFELLKKAKSHYTE